MPRRWRHSPAVSAMTPPPRSPAWTRSPPSTWPPPPTCPGEAAGRCGSPPNAGTAVWSTPSRGRPSRIREGHLLDVADVRSLAEGVAAGADTAGVRVRDRLHAAVAGRAADRERVVVMGAVPVVVDVAVRLRRRGQAPEEDQPAGRGPSHGRCPFGWRPEVRTFGYIPARRCVGHARRG